MSAMFSTTATAINAAGCRTERMPFFSGSAFAMPAMRTSRQATEATSIFIRTDVITSVSSFLVVLFVVSLLLPGLVVLISLSLLLIGLTGLVGLESLVGLTGTSATRTAQGD